MAVLLGLQKGKGKAVWRPHQPAINHNFAKFRPCGEKWLALGPRVVSVCVVAGLFGAAGPAFAQVAGTLQPTTVDDTTASGDLAAPVPRLTIAPEEEVPALPQREAIADPYAPLGIRQGGITYFPALAIDALASSNFSQSASNPHSAVGVHLRPSIRFESDWVRHYWQGLASGDITPYLKKDATADKAANASSRFRLDIRRDTHAELAASYDLSQVGAEDSDVPNTAIGKRTDHTFNANAALTHEFGALQGQVKLGLEREIFEDVKLSGGSKEDNGDRNNFTPSLGLRVAYTDPPALKPFTEIIYAPRFHDQKRDRNGLARDSRGLTASLGVALDRGPIWSGEAAIVYAVRGYKDPALKTNSAFGINGNLIWRPTDLTSVVLTLGTALDETASATSSGSKIYSSRLDLTHALRDDVNLLAGAGYSTTRAPGGTEDTMTSRLGVEWRMNPELAWTASYDGTWFKGATKNDDYNEQRLSVGLIMRR
jgi:hypothetical protein